MIFQSPRTALNPIRKVGHADRGRAAASTRNVPPPRCCARHAIEALARVRIPDPERRYDAYPFELSGGMCQRVMIAMALACSPSLLIADEPTTGLDVTTQAVIMDLIRDMSRDAGMSTLLITHDLGLAGEYCDRIAVMHAGHVGRDRADRGRCWRAPHTRTPASCSPRRRRRNRPSTTWCPIPGQLPDLRRRPAALPLQRRAASAARPRCDERAAAVDRDSSPNHTRALPGAAVTERRCSEARDLAKLYPGQRAAQGRACCTRSTMST